MQLKFYQLSIVSHINKSWKFQQYTTKWTYTTNITKSTGYKPWSTSLSHCVTSFTVFQNTLLLHVHTYGGVQPIVWISVRTTLLWYYEQLFFLAERIRQFPSLSFANLLVTCPALNLRQFHSRLTVCRSASNRTHFHARHWNVHTSEIPKPLNMLALIYPVLETYRYL